MKKLLNFVLFILLNIILMGQNIDAQNSTSTPPPPCSTPEFRQFDFWIGDWEVYRGEKIVGTNKVELILGDCVIQENWEGAGGSVGKSFNTYDAQKETWNQVWVDNGGNRIDFHGHYQDGKMLLTGEGESKQEIGKKVYYKLTFFNNDNGTVRQLWEASYDREKWNIIFDGLYVKKK